MDRFELNAMVERLLESDGGDAEAREAVAAFFATMKRSSPWRFQSHISTPGDKITGQTHIGTLQIEDDRPVERKLSLGAREERVGQYKLVRQGRELEIAHFWKSGLGTFSQTELPREWRLCMDRKGRPIWFGERGVKDLFTIPLVGRYVRVLVTREVYVKRWGAEGPETRLGALAFQVYITNE